MTVPSQQAIQLAEQGNREVLKRETWLKYLVLTKENKVNFERIESMRELSENQILAYVKRTLEVLERIETSEENKKIVEEVLKWSEVAKGGMPSVRNAWRKKGIDLYAHNIGSRAIYEMDYPENEIVSVLIGTHGLIGQFLRGETMLKENFPLFELVQKNLIEKEQLKEILIVLNECILSGVAPSLWEELKEEIVSCIEEILSGNLNELPLKEKLKRLRNESVQDGENLTKQYDTYVTKEVKDALESLFASIQLWYVEPALKEFSFEEFVKIFLLIASHSNYQEMNLQHITLEPFMNSIYYEHKGKKKINIYKKRVIEKYLKDVTLEEILNGKLPENKHVGISIHIDQESVLLDFIFSPVGEALITFCVEAEKADVEHEKAIILLFDLFELRRDSYDRFHNEDRYLAQMHASADDKKIILDYVEGEQVLDIGPGSGVMLDMITEAFPKKKVAGVDISQNVIEELVRKKEKEHRPWEVYQGDALNLIEYFPKESVNTIVYSSIIHEFFSYIPFEGKKFNHKTLEVALKSAFEVLAPGGRMIIRDGIMTDSEEYRVIEFKDPSDLAFLTRYARDFEGRKIQYEMLSETKVKMPINDAMEFLYTYTWGEESYVHEINEQFGYFTPKNYEAFIYDTLGKEQVKIVEQMHYLQQGYADNLQEKINFYDEEGKEVALPDSTCLFVIEKVENK